MPDTPAPQPRPDPNEKLVKVFDTELESEALLVQGLIESAGIDSDLRAIETQDAFPIGGAVILVREEDAAEAAKVIEAYRQSPPLEEDDTAATTG